MQNITINGFLGVKLANIELVSMTIIIGEQATGKSVVARLVYFFNEYFADFDEVSLFKKEHKSSYDKRKKEEFYQIFPPYSWEKDDFEITYSNKDHIICISSLKNSSVIDIKTSASVASYFRKLKNDFQKFTEQDQNGKFSNTRTLRGFRRYQIENGVSRYKNALFVPAARSFYATIRDEIFSLLALDNKIDNIILQFGEFYESAKMRMSYFPPNEARLFLSIEKKYFEEIVKGQLIRDEGRDWIEMDRGKIELSKASSGQQEAVPLIIAISRFPDKNKTLIIEEPEAHLFPTAQIKVLDFIIRQVNKKESPILFTTHSPYLLSATNNYILRAKIDHVKSIEGKIHLSNSIDSKNVRAYLMHNGKSSSLIDTETGLISADYIDSVSEDIGEEFEKALGAIHENS